MRSLTRITSAALDLALPAMCAGCGREGEPLCESCRPALDARLDLPAGTPLGLPSDIPAPLLQLEWCAPFAGPVRHALHQLKYTGERRLAVPLGNAVARRWARVGIGTTVVVPVPVHADRESQRGYDQAALIAIVAAERLGLPYTRALERGRATVAQFELGRDQRAANVADAFRLRDAAGRRAGSASGGGAGSAAGSAATPATRPAATSAATRATRPAAPSAAQSAATQAALPPATSATHRAIAGRWVLLVDDVVTTGATLAACAEALIDGGAAAVSAIAVARER